MRYLVLLCATTSQYWNKTSTKTFEEVLKIGYNIKLDSDKFAVIEQILENISCTQPSFPKWITKVNIVLLENESWPKNIYFL